MKFFRGFFWLYKHTCFDNKTVEQSALDTAIQKIWNFIGADILGYYENNKKYQILISC